MGRDKRMVGIMNYLKMLEDGYIAECKFREIHSKLEFLSDEIFNFTAYDTEIAELFATKAIEVCNAITDGSTFEYIKDPENYRWFLIMCNFPFFYNRIEWGTSVRGAWWQYEIWFYSSGLYNGEEQLQDEIKFTRKEWEKFTKAISEFACTS